MAETQPSDFYTLKRSINDIIFHSTPRRENEKHDDKTIKYMYFCLSEKEGDGGGSDDGEAGNLKYNVQFYIFLVILFGVS